MFFFYYYTSHFLFFYSRRILTQKRTVHTLNLDLFISIFSILQLSEFKGTKTLKECILYEYLF